MIVNQIIFLMALEDIYHMQVSNILQAILLLAVLILGDVTLERIALALGIFIVYLLYERFKEVKIGGADVKILASLTLYGGAILLVKVLLVSSVLGIVYSLLSKKKRIPYVPFIWMGYLLASL